MLRSSLGAVVAASAAASAACLVLAGCGDDRHGGGYRVVHATDSGREPPPRQGDASEPREGDASEPRWDGGFGFDAGFGSGDASDASDAWADANPFHEDAWSPEPDAGFFFDAGSGDASDGGRDGGRDATPFDIGFPFPDGGFPSGDGGGGGTDSGVQTNVFVNSGSHLVLDLRPPVPSDPLQYSTVLQYDNGGPGNENISITGASAVVFFFSTQNFAMGPSHFATVGSTTQMVAKVPGTADVGIPASSSFCGTPAFVTIGLSNGLQLTDLVTVECLQ